MGVPGNHLLAIQPLRAAAPAQSLNVVDDVCPCIQHRLHHFRLVGIDRNGNAQAHGFLHHRQNAAQLFIHRHSGRTGPGRFPANVQNARALVHQRFCMPQCTQGVGMLPAV